MGCLVHFGFLLAVASNADALPIYPTLQAEPLLLRRGRLKGQRVKHRKVPVPVPYRTRLLGVCGADECARLDRLRDETE